MDGDYDDVYKYRIIHEQVTEGNATLSNYTYSIPSFPHLSPSFPRRRESTGWIPSYWL